MIGTGKAPFTHPAPWDIHHGPIAPTWLLVVLVLYVIAVAAITIHEVYGFDFPYWVSQQWKRLRFETRRKPGRLLGTRVDED